MECCGGYLDKTDGVTGRWGNCIMRSCIIGTACCILVLLTAYWYCVLHIGTAYCILVLRAAYWYCVLHILRVIECIGKRGEACSTCGEKNAPRILTGSLKERQYLGDQAIDGRIMLKCIFILLPCKKPVYFKKPNFLH